MSNNQIGEFTWKNLGLALINKVELIERGKYISSGYYT